MQRYYTLRPSRLLAMSLVLLCSASLAALWSLSLPMTTQIVLTMAVLSSGGYSLSRDANLRLQHSCVAFRLEGQEEVMLVLRNGRHLPCRMSRESLVTPWLVVLNVALREQRGRRSLVILQDAMGADSFRRLRVALRWGGEADQAAK